MARHRDIYSGRRPDWFAEYVAEKSIPWWRRALNFALDGLRAVFFRGSRGAAENKPEPAALASELAENQTRMQPERSPDVEAEPKKTPKSQLESVTEQAVTLKTTEPAEKMLPSEDQTSPESAPVVPQEAFDNEQTLPIADKFPSKNKKNQESTSAVPQEVFSKKQTLSTTEKLPSDDITCQGITLVVLQEPEKKERALAPASALLRISPDIRNLAAAREPEPVAKTAAEQKTKKKSAAAAEFEAEIEAALPAEPVEESAPIAESAPQPNVEFLHILEASLAAQAAAEGPAQQPEPETRPKEPQPAILEEEPITEESTEELTENLPQIEVPAEEIAVSEVTTEATTTPVAGQTAASEPAAVEAAAEAEVEPAILAETAALKQEAEAPAATIAEPVSDPLAETPEPASELIEEEVITVEPLSGADEDEGALAAEPVNNPESASEASASDTEEPAREPEIPAMEAVAATDEIPAAEAVAEASSETQADPAEMLAEAPPEVPTPAEEKATARQESIRKKIAEADPDSAISISVAEVYDGPLDLLLDLIRKQDIDIYDIPIARITAQFLSYVDRMKATDVDVAGEFIYIASLLIHIKSKMLLPRMPAEAGEQPEDPRRELVERLLEHERFKNAAQMLLEKQMLEAASWSNPGLREFQNDEGTEPEIAADTVDLVRVFREILDRARKRPVINVNEDSVTVGQMIQFLTRRLSMEDKPVALRRLLSHSHSERALIATFLALLELVRMQAILLRQDRAFSDIFIKKSDGFDNLLESGALTARDDWR